MATASASQGRSKRSPPGYRIDFVPWPTAPTGLSLPRGVTFASTGYLAPCVSPRRGFCLGTLRGLPQASVNHAGMATEVGPVGIRRLTTEDAAQYRTFRLAALQESPDSFETTYEESVRESVEDFAGRFSKPGQFMLGAFAPDLAGAVGLYQGPSKRTRHKGTVFAMYVSPQYRDRGIGRLLVEALIAEARSQLEIEQIHLRVVTTNRSARALYAACGFETYGVEAHALKTPSGYLDDELMVLRL